MIYGDVSMPADLQFKTKVNHEILRRAIENDVLMKN